MSNSKSRAALDACIDTIESGYEYFLAYAAQGRQTDRDAGASTSQVRQHLADMAQAMDGVGAVARACAEERSPDVAEVAAAFFAAIDDDAAKAAAVLRLSLAQPDISSQLIDNLNASIHVRALLTDIFIVDEALKSRAKN